MSATSTCCPSPVRSLAHSAAIAPNAASSEQVASPTGGPAFTGSPPANPVTAIIPLRACATGSMPGRPAYGPLDPKVDTDTDTARGLRACTDSKSRPRDCRARGRRLSTTTSAHPSSPSRTCRPSGVVRSTAMLRLLRFTPTNTPLSSPRRGPIRRVSSPAGGSSFTTSAPMSPSSVAAYGPASIDAASSTLMPSNAATATPHSGRRPSCLATMLRCTWDAPPATVAITESV